MADSEIFAYVNALSSEEERLYQQAGDGSGLSDGERDRLARDPEQSVRRQAVDALGHCGKPAVGPLIESLKDLNKDILIEATYSLGRLGTNAAAAVPALILLLKDDDDDVKKAAAEALKKIDPKAAAKTGVGK